MISTRQRWLLVLLAGVSFMNYMDRMILPAVAESLKREFALSDTAIGLLNGFAFMALYGASSLPLSRLADRTSRSLVLAGALAFWSLATIACGLVRNVWQLFIARACVGIGESACQPVGYALASEQFPPEKRHSAIGWFLLGNNLGITAGFALGGWLGATYGWRTAFIVAGIPGLFLAVALASYRTQSVAQVSAPPPFLATVRSLWKNSIYRLLVWLSAVFSMTIFGPIAFLPAFFVRSHGMPMSAVGLYSGLAIGLGMAVGVLSGGAIADRLARRGAEHPQRLCAVAIVLSGLAFLAAFTLADPRLAFAAVFIAAALGSIASPVISTAIQNESPNDSRATAASLGTLAVSIAGIGLAPLLIGMMSDAFAPSYGVHSLRMALIVALSFTIGAAALHWRIGTLLAARRVAQQTVEQHPTV